MSLSLSTKQALIFSLKHADYFFFEKYLSSHKDSNFVLLKLNKKD